MKKVFIMGIDGGSLDLIKKWKEDLPNFSKIIRNGTSGYLHTIIPMLTLPAWTSFSTGKNPGKHNIFDFFKFKNYNKELVRSNDRKTGAIWDILSNHDKRSVILNLPATYPPQPFNGIMICGGDTPSLKYDFTYPKDFKDKILSLFPDYKTGIDWNNLEYKRYDKFLDDLYKITEDYKNLIMFLMKNEQWDLFVTVFEDIDRLQHYFWKYMDTNHPHYVKENKYENAIKDYYKRLDKIIGEIIEKIDENTIFFIVSDHGFGPLYKQVFINNFLLEKGFLKLRENNKKNINLRSILIKIVYSLRIKHLIPRLPSKFRYNLKKIIPSNLPNITEIDWGNTKAYFDSYSGQHILINLIGRESNGFLKEEEYNQFIENLKLELLKLEDNGKKIIKKVYTSKELYNGGYIKNAPDIFIVTEEGYILSEGFGEKLISYFDENTNYRSGEHRDNGILFIKGEEIKKGCEIEANLLDIVPTILHILEIAPPEDLDGKIIDCFN